MLSNRLYYTFRPLIPRRFQIAIRRAVVQRKRKQYADVWPIDPNSATPPPNWQGWPDGKKFALVLTHDVETAVGRDKCLQLAELEKGLGFRSSFNFVAADYDVPLELRSRLEKEGFEVGVHGLRHSENIFASKSVFDRSVPRINQYLKEWKCVGFRSPKMFHNLDWIGGLDIQYDSSTFDTDPFEPQPDGLGTIFPRWVPAGNNGKGYVELPYTLPQDFTLFVTMQEQRVDIWKRKLDWIANHGGMALLVVHPDYIQFDGRRPQLERYPAVFYEEFLEYLKAKYDGQYWSPLPGDLARFWARTYRPADSVTLKPAGDVPAAKAAVDRASRRAGPRRKRIWIDLDNSPHVPFFSPIIGELDKLNYDVLLTVRDCSQTCGLADLFEMKYRRIGRHYGKKKILKIAGTMLRATQLSAALRTEDISIAVSHGSRAQMMSALMLHVPSIAIMDYEHVKGFIRPTWIMIPEVINSNSLRSAEDHILKYPGIKEDVYVPCFRPDPGILDELKIDRSDLIVTVRPPATEAHYHNPESEALFLAAVNRLGTMDDVRMVILPRYDAQKSSIQSQWPEWCGNGKILIPEQVVDGLNLLWYSDFAISGGGTMNREAAALGVPVYSIFRGKIGAVDRYLADTGRLVLLEKVEDVQTKLTIVKRDIPSGPPDTNGKTLTAVVEGIIRALEAQGSC